MPDKDIALMAHLMRRAGFGATRDELESRVAKGYEATVEELIHPEGQPDVEFDLMERYVPEYGELAGIEANQQGWAYRMCTTQRPFQEKVVLFWHGILCTGFAKIDHGRMMSYNIDLFRQFAFGNFRTLLVELSKHPTMVYYLDNNDNHKGNINENFGRELLELFSLGVGMDGDFNYTEDDVKAASKAFTGWNIEPTYPTYPYGRALWKFRYDPADHDDSEKTLLGETGHWNGEDVIDIILRQPGTVRFIARHLYNFFVADEPQVPAWKDTPPRDVEAIQTLEKAIIDNDYELRPVYRTLFNSEFFKDALFQKVKSPAEVVIGTVRLTKDHQGDIKRGMFEIMQECTYMGQDLMNPPSVEGWHTGREWIDSGTLVERINFVADQISQRAPGVQLIIDRLSDGTTPMAAEEFVDGCLDLMGPIEVQGDTRKSLVEYAAAGGELKRDSEEARGKFADRVVEMLQLISATAEYQYA